MPYYPVKQPVSQGVDQPYARWTYETDLSEAVSMSAPWSPLGCRWAYRFRGKVINGVDSDRLLYNSADVGGNARVFIQHGADRVSVQPSDSAAVIPFDFPVGAVPTDGLIDLYVYVDLALGLAAVHLNGNLLTSSFTPVPGDTVVVDQITGGGGTNRYQGQLYDIDLIDPAGLQGRFITNGDNIDGYMSFPNVDTSAGAYAVEIDYIAPAGIEAEVESVAIGFRRTDNGGFVLLKPRDNSAGWKISTQGLTPGQSPNSPVSGMHYRLRLEYTTTQINLYVDGSLEHSVAVTAPNRPYYENADWECRTTQDANLSGWLQTGGGAIANIRFEGSLRGSFYPVDETSGTVVFDTALGQDGTRVNMDASNFEYIPVNTQKWRFGDLKPEDLNVGADTPLPPMLGDIDLEISNTRADGLKAA